MTKLQKDQTPGSIKYFDKNELIELLAYDTEKIQNASMELRNDEDIGRIILNEEPGLIGWLSSSLRDNADFLLENLKPLQHYWQIYDDEIPCQISKRLRDDKDFVIKMIPLLPNLYKYISISLRKDKEIYLIEDRRFINKASLDLRSDFNLNLKKVINGDPLHWVSRKLMSNKKFILEALKAGADPYITTLGPKVRKDREVIIQLLKSGGGCTFDVPRNLLTDLEILETAIKFCIYGVSRIPKKSFSKEAIPILQKQTEAYLPFLKESLLEDKNIILDAIKNNVDNFWHASKFRLDSDCVDLAKQMSLYPKSWKNVNLKGIKAVEIDRERALNFINIHCEIIYNLPKKLFSDRKFILEAAPICGLIIIPLINKSLEVDKEILLACLKDSDSLPWKWQTFHESLQFISDPEILLKLVFKDPSFFKNLPEQYRDDRPFVKKLLNSPDVQRVVLDKWRGGKEVFPYLSDRLKDDEEIVGLGASAVDMALWSDRFKKNKKLLLKVLKNSYWSYEFDRNIPDELRDNLPFMREAVKISPRNFSFASERLKDNKSLLLLALEKKAHALKDASSRLKNNKEVVLKAFNKTPSSLKHSSKKLRCNKKFLKEIFDSNPIDIFHNCYFTIRRQPEIYIPAIKEDSRCCIRFSSNIIFNLDFSGLTRKQQLEIYETFENRTLNKDIFSLANAKKKILKEPDRISYIEKKSSS